MISDEPGRKSSVPVARFVDIGDGMPGFELRQGDIQALLLFSILYELQELRSYMNNRFG